MILRPPRECVSGRIQFDMAAQNEADRAIFDEGRDPLCAGKIGAGIVD